MNREALEKAVEKTRKKHGKKQLLSLIFIQLHDSGMTCWNFRSFYGQIGVMVCLRESAYRNPFACIACSIIDISSCYFISFNQPVVNLIINFKEIMLPCSFSLFDC